MTMSTRELAVRGAKHIDSLEQARMFFAYAEDAKSKGAYANHLLFAYQGKQAFAVVYREPRQDEYGVYLTLWKLKGCPKGNPEYGRQSFHDIEGLSSTAQEKAEAVASYLRYRVPVFMEHYLPYLPSVHGPQVQPTDHFSLVLEQVLRIVKFPLAWCTEVIRGDDKPFSETAELGPHSRYIILHPMKPFTADEAVNIIGRLFNKFAEFNQLAWGTGNLYKQLTADERDYEALCVFRGASIAVQAVSIGSIVVQLGQAAAPLLFAKAGPKVVGSLAGHVTVGARNASTIVVQSLAGHVIVGGGHNQFPAPIVTQGMQQSQLISRTTPSGIEKAFSAAKGVKEPDRGGFATNVSKFAKKGKEVSGGIDAKKNPDGSGTGQGYIEVTKSNGKGGTQKMGAEAAVNVDRNGKVTTSGGFFFTYSKEF